MLKEYVKNYRRVVIVSDHVTHEASDIIYYDILESIMGVYSSNGFLINKADEFHKFDEFNDRWSYGADITRRGIYDNLMRKIKPNDYFVIRCEYYNSMNDTSSVPTKVLYNADLCIYTVMNVLTVIKDRGQTPEKYLDGIDLRNIGKSYKLNKIMKRINT